MNFKTVNYCAITTNVDLNIRHMQCHMVAMCNIRH